MIWKDPQELVAKIRARSALNPSAPVGVVGSFCHGTKVHTGGGNREIVSIVNTLDIDSDNEVVFPAGADRTYLKANKQVFVDHRYTTDSAVGFVRKMLPVPREGEQTAWEAHTGVYDKPGNKLGDDILTMARECGVGASIGFLATDYGPPNDAEIKFFKSRNMATPRSVVRAYKMLEYSLTAFPCNVACQGYALTDPGAEKRVGVIDELVTKGRISRWSAALLGAPITPKRAMHATTGPSKRTVWLV